MTLSQAHKNNAGKLGSSSRKTVALVLALLLCAVASSFFASKEAWAQEENQAPPAQEAQPLVTTVVVSETVVDEPTVPETPPVVETLPLETVAPVEAVPLAPVATPESIPASYYLTSSSGAPDPAPTSDSGSPAASGSLSPGSTVLSDTVVEPFYRYEAEVGSEAGEEGLGGSVIVLAVPTTTPEPSGITTSTTAVSSGAVSKPAEEALLKDDSISSSMQPELAHLLTTVASLATTAPESVELLGEAAPAMSGAQQADDALEAADSSSYLPATTPLPAAETFIGEVAEKKVVGPPATVLEQPMLTYSGTPTLPIVQSLVASEVTVASALSDSGVQASVSPSSSGTEKSPSPGGSTPPPITLQESPLGSSFSLPTGGGQAGSGGETVPLLLLCLLASGLILLRPDGMLPLFIRELPTPTSALLLPLERPG